LETIHRKPTRRSVRDWHCANVESEKATVEGQPVQKKISTNTKGWGGKEGGGHSEN